jgi:hypothetical protein
MQPRRLEPPRLLLLRGRGRYMTLLKWVLRFSGLLVGAGVLGLMVWFLAAIFVGAARELLRALRSSETTY